MNTPTSRIPVDFNQFCVEARQLSHLYLSTEQKLSIEVPADNDIVMCGNAIMNEVQFGQGIRQDDFQDSSVIPHS
jgi:hypothetical protein